MPAPPIIVEDGTGKPDANSYVSLLDAEAYFEGRLYNETWAGTSPDRKNIALITATREIDANMEFSGYRSKPSSSPGLGQALEWPRFGVPNTNELYWYGAGSGLLGTFAAGAYYPSNSIPKRLIAAVIELAQELLKVDRTAEWSAKGVSSIGLGQSALALTFSADVADRPKVFTDEVRALLQPFGIVRIGRSMARTRRG